MDIVQYDEPHSSPWADVLMHRQGQPWYIHNIQGPVLEVQLASDERVRYTIMQANSQVPQPVLGDWFFIPSSVKTWVLAYYISAGLTERHEHLFGIVSPHKLRKQLIPGGRFENENSVCARRYLDRCVRVANTLPYSSADLSFVLEQILDEKEKYIQNQERIRRQEEEEKQRLIMLKENPPSPRSEERQILIKRMEMCKRAIELIKQRIGKLENEYETEPISRGSYFSGMGRAYVIEKIRGEKQSLFDCEQELQMHTKQLEKLTPA
jgi:uncharacterized protein (DUF1778 family)